MSRIRFLYIAFVFAVVFALTVKANAAEPVFSEFIEDETILIVHIDLRGIDIPKVIENNKPLLDKVVETLDLRSEELQHDLIPNETDRKRFAEIIGDWDTLANLAQGGKAFLESVIGIDEAYLYVNLKGPGIINIVIPKNDKLNITVLKSMIPESEHRLMHETEKYLIIAIPSLVDGGTVDDRIAALAERTGTVKPREGFLNAWNAVEDYPIKIMVSPPTYLKKVLKEIPLKFPRPFDKIDLEKLIGGLAWKAAGFDPAKPEFYAVAEAESEIAAKEIQIQSHLLLNTIGNVFCEWAGEGLEREAIPAQEKELIRTFAGMLTPENRKTIIETLIPEPQGKRFVLKAESEEIESFTENAMPLIVKFFESQIRAAHEAARRMQCTNNLKQIMIAFHNYHDTNGSFPPAFTVDDNGKPLHSWRVLILPYMEQKALYDSIKLDEPWNSEHNKKFHDMMPPIYRCPSCTLWNEKRETTYCMVVGEDTLGKTDGNGIKLRQITDGTSNTIGVLERKTSECWMAPVDITQKDTYFGINRRHNGIGSEHTEGVNAAYCDGSVRFISETIDLDVLKAILSIAGGESKTY